MKLKSKRLIAQMTTVRNRMSGGRVGAVVKVPPDLAWWYFQEFGTATHLTSGNAEYGVAPSGSPEGYEIHPRNAKGIMLPDIGNGTMSLPFIGAPHAMNHPGVSPKSFVRRVLQTVRADAATGLASALLTSGLDISSVQTALMEEVMPAVVTTIGSSMGEMLPGGRSDDQAKLKGRSAQDVFETSATIVST